MIQIITDSAADFSPEELQRMNIACINLTVMFGDSEYRENENLTKDRFYELLQESGELPKTSQASPQVLMDLFEASHRNGDEAVYITISSEISGTYQNAMMSKSLLDYESCAVVDSRNATGGQRILVEHAVRLRDAGKKLEEIVAELELLRDRIVLAACIDTLEYLYRGGRISQTAYKLGTLANIKPIITVETDGSIAVPAKAMGMRKGMDTLCKKLESRKPDPDFGVYVVYTNNPDVARNLAARLAEQGTYVPESHLIQVGAAIGAHIGPEACGLVYVS